MKTKEIIFTALLIFIPIAITAHLLKWSALVVFITAGLAIVPLAAWMGTATEEIAVVLGPSLGGLLNATFGNATELIIGFVALKGGLINVVKATLAGSIVGNLLLVTGLAMLLGGLRYREQEFPSVVARLNASAMNLAVIAMLLPTAAKFTSSNMSNARIQNLSIGVAIILILIYGLTLLFSMRTHTYLYNVGLAEMKPGELAEANLATDNPKHRVNIKFWIGVLLGSTIMVAIESELLVDSLKEATSNLGLSSLFTGVILLPIIGNAAEHATAVTVAMKNKMELSLSVAVGSSLQIALFVAPVLVLLGWLIHQPMDLNFEPFELVAVTVAVLIANSISSDGRSNWLEGALLLGTYAVIGLAFYFYPAS